MKRLALILITALTLVSSTCLIYGKSPNTISTSDSQVVNQKSEETFHTIVTSGSHNSNSGSLGICFSIFGNKQFDAKFSITNNGTNTISWKMIDANENRLASGRLDPGKNITSKLYKEALIDGRYELNVINDDGSLINVNLKVQVLD